MATRDELLPLLQDIFDSSIQLQPSPNSTSLPLTHSAPSLILQSAQSASPAQIADLILRLLLGHPPFIHGSPNHWKLHTARFLSAWSIPRSRTDRDTLSPYDCLSILSRQRLEFQQVDERGFNLVASLLLACLKLLSPDAAHRRGDGRTWSECHGKAVVILGELLHGVPRANWEELDSHAQYSQAVWECLEVLCSGAGWWSREDSVYRENMVLLATHVFRMPTVSSILRASMRISMKPSDVHQTITVLLQVIERRMGVPESQPINAFTPTPFSFPMLLSLDRHTFTNDFEFASLRVLFVSWLSALPVYRNAQEAMNPWKMQAVLQHTEAVRRLEAHPPSGVRVALIYIFNETQLETGTFKPATDLKAIELLKRYIGHRVAQSSGTTTPKTFRSTSSVAQLQQAPESCVTIHAEWALPWLWRRRATDNDFILVITSAWLITTCARIGRLCIGHPVYETVLKHTDSAFGVIHDFFRFVFTIDFVNNSADTKSTLKRVRTLYKIVIELALLVATEKPQVLNQQFIMLTIRCCVSSLDSEWIPLEGWSQTCEMLCKVSMADLTDGVRFAQIVMASESFIPIILRDMETITAYCSRITTEEINVEVLATLITKLTHQVHFLTILSAAHSPLHNRLARESHLISSAIHYATFGYTDVLTASEKSELAWLHSASVAALIELLVVIDFGNVDSGSSSTATVGMSTLKTAMEPKDKQEEAGRMIKCIIARNFEMSYVTAALCKLSMSIEIDYWDRNPFLYLEVGSYLRNVLLDEEIHKWCKLVPVIVHGFSILLGVNSAMSQTFLASRWNLSLCTRLFKILLSTENPSCVCPTCNINLFPSVTALLKIFLSPHPPWQCSLLVESGLGQYSILELAAVETKFRDLADLEKFDDANKVLELCECFSTWSTKVKIIRRSFERAWRGKYGKSWKSGIGMALKNAQQGNDERRDSGGGESWYLIWKPVEGLPGVLVSS